MSVATPDRPPRPVGDARQSIARDLIIALLLFATAAILGAQFVRTLRHARLLPDVTGLEQQTFGAALMNVCGRGLHTPILPMAPEPNTPADQVALIEFLVQRREAITCAEIPADVPAASGAVQETSRYLLMMCELPWRVGAKSWAAFDWLLGGMFAVAIVFAFAAARVVMHPAIATAVAASYMFSPIHLANIVDVRDYSKTPFFAITLFVLTLLIVRKRRSIETLGLAAVIGLVLGFGFGMRTDVALNLPLIWVGLALFLPESFFESWKLRAAAIALSLVTFIAAAAPILTSQQSGSLLFHWGLLGFSEQFDRELGIVQAPYELGHFYDDSYAAATVDAYAYRVSGVPETTRYGTPRYSQFSREYYGLLLRTFPADAFLRGEAAAIRVLGLPFGNDRLAHPDRLPAVWSSIISFRSRLLGIFPHAGIIIFAVVVLAASARSLRLAFAVLTFVALLGAYPAIQFQMRHYFHLELLSLALLGLCFQRPRLGSAPQFALRAGGFAALAGLVVLLPLWGLRMYQQRSAAALLDRYERADTVALVTHPVAVDGKSVSLVDASDILPLDGVRRPIRSEQVVVEVDPSSCPAGVASVTFKYTMTTAGDYSRTFTVRGSERAHVFVTVYESETTTPPPHHFVFNRIQVPDGQVACVRAIKRLARPEAFALLLPAVLPATWRDLPLYQRLRVLSAPAGGDVTHD